MIKAQHQDLPYFKIIHESKEFMNNKILLPTDEQLKKSYTLSMIENIKTHWHNLEVTYEIITKPKPRLFLVEENPNEWFNQSVVKQNYSITMHLPFNNVFINYQKPLALLFQGRKGKSNTLHANALYLSTHTSTTPKPLGEGYLTLIRGIFFATDDMRTFEIKFATEMLPDFGSMIKPDEYCIQSCDYYRYIKTINPDFSDSCRYINSIPVKPCKLMKSQARLLNFIINQINFLNATNVKFVPAGISTKSNRERERQGLPTLPPPYYCCKVELPKTIREGNTPISGEHKRFKFKFDVRGHFRHLMSEYYKNKQGQMIWIPPHQRGEGVYIPKTYHFIDKEEELGAGGSVGP